MSEETKTELKLPKAYRRPTLARYVNQGYLEENYERSMSEYETRLSAAYSSGELTDEAFEAEMAAAALNEAEDMADADHDGLPDVLHVRSQVRAQANRTQRARHPTRHRFKQYLFADPSKRLVRKRPLRVSAELVRQNLDELIEKESIGILSVHAPNGQRIDLAALKAGRVLMAPLAPTPALPNPPLDSAANDVPAGENIQQYLGGTYVNDPAADEVVEQMLAEKAIEVGKKEKDPEAKPEEPGDFVDPAEPAPPVVSTELEQPPMGVDGNTAPIQPAPDTDTETSTETPTAPAFQGEAPEQQADATASSSSSKGKKGRR